MTRPVTPSPPHPDRRVPRDRWWAAALFLLLLGVYVATATRSIISMDVWSANLASWRIATAGVPWLDGLVIPELDGHPLESTWVREAENGHRVVGRSPGVVAAALPAYWLAQPATMSLAPGAITAALLTAGAVLLLHLAIAPHLPRRHALLASGVFALATPVWSVAANGMWPHTVSVLGITGMAYAASRGRWWLVGVFGGVALWGRLHAALIVAILGLALGVARRRQQVVWLVGAMSGAFLLLLCGWSRWMYGTWDPTASYDMSTFTDFAGRNRLSFANHAGFWISPDRGILIWTPLLVLLLPALVRAWRDVPDWSRSLLVGGLVYTALQATLNRFSGGDTFYGYRLGLEFLACAAPAFALASPRMGAWARRLFTPILSLQFCAILVGSLQEGYFAAAERVWQENAFVNALMDQPAALATIVAICLLAGALAQRIWVRAESAERETTHAEG